MTTLIVSEKPSIAKSIAQLLSPGNVKSVESFATPVFQIAYEFKDASTLISTSVAGHLFEIQFTKAVDSWEVPEERLFDSENISYALTKGAGEIVKQLQLLAKQAKYLILALDNDREGENICFEVIRSINFKGSVFRILFSALTREELVEKMAKLTTPDKNLSDAVEVRQELDLKIGVAFTRYETKFLQQKYSDLNTKCVSYGPCQTPALNFCVERHLEILKFRPEKYYAIEVSVADSNGFSQEVAYSTGRLSEEEAQKLAKELESSDVTITSISESKGKSIKPLPLNTVEMLKMASEYLRMSPQEAMHRAEGLYLEGYLTYPRTESSSYPQGFGFMEVVDGIGAAWALPAVQELKLSGINPRKGTDAGDHPPITPTGKNGEDLSGTDLSFYTMILKHFLASILPDAEFTVKTVALAAGSHKMNVKTKEVTYQGWQMVYNATSLKEYDEDLDDYENAHVTFVKDGTYKVASAIPKERYTKPPSYLTESQLLSLMEKNQIGTDASMAEHIENIEDRNYVQLNTESRELIPTQLGVQLISGLRLIDYELVAPTLRSDMEKSLTLVAEGKKSKVQMLKEQLAKYLNKFTYFKANIDILDQLFESKFQSLKQAGKPFVECQQCNKYTKFISLLPERIYCSTCDRIYQVPEAKKVIETSRKCEYCGMQTAAACGDKCQQRHVPFCPKCYTDGSAELTADIEQFNQAHAAKGVTCDNCMSKACPTSLYNCYVGDCPHCSIGGFDHKFGFKAKPQETQANACIIEIAPEPKCIIEIAPEREPQFEEARTKNQLITHIPGKLYLDTTTYPETPQISCTSCGSLTNLDAKVELLKDQFCEQCGCRMLRYKEKLCCCACDEEQFQWMSASEVQMAFRGKGKYRGKPSGGQRPKQQGARHGTAPRASGGHGRQ